MQNNIGIDSYQLIKKVEDLAKYIQIPLPNLMEIYNIHESFPLKVPLSFVNKIIKNDINDPLLKQILPIKIENVIDDKYTPDPVNDTKYFHEPCIIRKYQSRALLTLTGQCAIHCRYCFRKFFPYEEATFHKNDLNQLLTFFLDHDEINEVIFSGGDPFSLNHKTLNEIIGQLQKVKSIKTLRFHSRIPVVEPKRIDKLFIESIRDNRFNKILVIHVNHPNEIDDEFGEKMDQLSKAGFTLLNQSVLLKEINDDVEILTELSYKLFQYKVLPYYLNQLDSVQGSQHFYVEQSVGIKIIEGLQRNLSGYLVPKYVKDISGFGYKTILS